MYHRNEDEVNARGVVLTGQPSVGVSVIRPPPRATTHQRTRSPGKTAFLNFMLARLISAGQVVLLCDDSEFHLVCNDKCTLGRRGPACLSLVLVHSPLRSHHLSPFFCAWLPLFAAIYPCNPSLHNINMIARSPLSRCNFPSPCSEPPRLPAPPTRPQGAGTCQFQEAGAMLSDRQTKRIYC